MKTLVSFLVASLAVASISCKDQGPSSLQPDYRTTPAAASFSACPTKDETNGNAPVADVFPDTQIVTITNGSRAAGGLKLTLSGPDATAFSLVNPPTSVPASGTAEVAIAFSPSKRSEFKATLTVDDEFDGTADLQVTLAGEGKNLPARATIEAAPESQAGGAFTTCEPTQYCEAAFPDTLYNLVATRTLKLRNVGCPALKITGLEITSTRGGAQGFTITEPVTQPSVTSPLILSSADGTQEISITIAFSPTNDGQGNPQRDAVLTITTNDALNPKMLIALAGNGVIPSAYASPTLCDFSNASDSCGFNSKVANQASFRISNDGNAPIKILSTTFKSSGNQTSGVSGRFTIASAVTGMTIGVGASVPLVVAHTDAPLYVTDILEVKAVFAADGVTPAGTLPLALFGGSKPCLSTDPLNTLNFNDPATTETTQTVTLKNGTGCGTLTLSDVSIDSSSFFRLSDPLIAANTQVLPGASVTANVTYKRPASGGMQIGTLRIVSNDSDYGAAKLVQLYSASPLDELPVAELRGCTAAQIATDAQCAMGATSTMTASLAALTSKTLTLSGITSYDPVPNMPGMKRPVTKYRFTLLPPLPANVTSMNLANSDMQIASATTTLALTAQAAVYRIGLTVYDDRAQQSTSSTLNVSITP